MNKRNKSKNSGETLKRINLKKRVTFSKTVPLLFDKTICQNILRVTQCDPAANEN